jgi:hypothetical protein
MVFPLGRAWANVFPSVKVFGVSINPGTFTIKEHVGSGFLSHEEVSDSTPSITAPNVALNHINSWSLLKISAESELFP